MPHAKANPPLNRKLPRRPRPRQKPSRATGKRYSNEEKAEIVQFVEAFNAQNGRGGQTAAVRKFGISQLSLAAWLKANGSGGLKSGTKASGSSLMAKLASLSMLHWQEDSIWLKENFYTRRMRFNWPDF